MKENPRDDRVCLLRVRKKTCFVLLGLALSAGGAVLVAEVALRIFYPQESLSPRWQFSPQYCSLPFPDTAMIHERPGRWRFVYTTNSRACRGTESSVSNRYDRPNVVILGDSYSFGAGVDDGHEYAAVLERSLDGRFGVVNLAVGGWGLTQEIRRFYEFGVLYAPGVVVLQYASNDPRDNLKCPVARVEDGRFAFRDTRERLYRIKSYLSRSLLQKSQVYNLVRNSIYRWFEARAVASTTRDLKEAGGGNSGPSFDQAAYVDLLKIFVEDLHRRGMRLIFLTVNGQLHESPVIEDSVKEMDRQGRLEFRDAAGWLGEIRDYSSLEGHLWGERAHRIIGQRLAEMIENPPIQPAQSDSPGPAVPSP